MRCSNFCAVLALFTAGCADTDDSVLRRETVEGHAEFAHRTYVEALDSAQRLQLEIAALVDAPSEDSLQKARAAWLAAREPYGISEVLRFSDGPIEEVEGRLNGWPMDEGYVDYVDGRPSSGIINDTSIPLTREGLVGLNEGGQGDIFGNGTHFDPERAVATGFHTIEFLLWGQDDDLDGPGRRPYTDYVVGEQGTAANADRRGRYLQLVADLLVDDLAQVAEQWEPDADNYRRRFVDGDPDDRLAVIITSFGTLAKAELAGERIDVALTTQDQEDEQSCFSDNTHRDVQLNVDALVAVYRGEAGGGVGPGIEAVVQGVDPELNDHMLHELERVSSNASGMPTPFDNAIARPGSDDWQQLDALVDVLFDLGDHAVEIGVALGLGNLDVSLPDEGAE